MAAAMPQRSYICRFIILWMVALEDASHITHGNGRFKGRPGGAEPLGDGGDFIFEKVSLKPSEKRIHEVELIPYQNG